MDIAFSFTVILKNLEFEIFQLTFIGSEIYNLSEAFANSSQLEQYGIFKIFYYESTKKKYLIDLLIFFQCTWTPTRNFTKGNSFVPRIPRERLPYLFPVASGDLW